jgi:hypothetical protein
VQFLAEQIEGLAAMLTKVTSDGTLSAEMRDRVDRLAQYVFSFFEEYHLINSQYMDGNGGKSARYCLPELFHPPHPSRH